MPSAPARRAAARAGAGGPGSRCGSPRSHGGRAVRPRRVPRARGATLLRARPARRSSATEELRYERLRAEVATLSSPESIVEAARAAGHAPGDVVDYIERRPPRRRNAPDRDVEHARRRSTGRRSRALTPSRRPPPRPGTAAHPRAPTLTRRAPTAGSPRTAPAAPAPAAVADRCGDSASARSLVVIVFGALAVRVTQLQVLSGDHYEAMALEQRLRTIPLARRARQHLRPQRARPRDLDRALVGVRRPDARHRPGAVRRRSSRRSSASTRQMLYERLSDRSRRFVYIARTVDDDGRGPGARPRAARRRRSCPSRSGSIPPGSVAGRDHRPRRRRGLRPRRPRSALRRRAPGHTRRGRRRTRPARPRHPRHRAAARRGRARHRPRARRSTRRCSTRSSGRSSTRSPRPPRRAAWRSSSTCRPATCSRWRRCRVRPTTEPARRRRARARRNKPLTDLFEPGSTNKLITIATAIENGVVGPHTPFDVPPTHPRRRATSRTPTRIATAATRTLVDDRHPARVVERRHDHDRPARSARTQLAAGAARLRLR